MADKYQVTFYAESRWMDFEVSGDKSALTTAYLVDTLLARGVERKYIGVARWTETTKIENVTEGMLPVA